MSERLTDDELSMLEKRFDVTPLRTLMALLPRAFAEIRAHRAAALTDEEALALSWLREWDQLDGHAPSSETGRAMHNRALAVLDRLLGQGEKR